MNNEKKPGKMEQKERFIDLRAAGHSFEAIAEELGVSKQTLISWSKLLALDVQNARSLRMDELFQRYAVGKEKRIEAFGKRLEAILAELDKRDLSEVKTEALFALALKYGEYLRGENEPVILRDKKGILDDLDNYGTATWEA